MQSDDSTYSKRRSYGPKPDLSRNRLCEVCGKLFRPSSQQLAKGAGRYCSNTCKGIAYSAPVNLNCEVCGKPFVTKASRVKDGNGRFCSKPCSNRARAIPEFQRFAALTGPVQEDGCRLWTGPTDSDGYGSFTMADGKQIGAHRYALMLALGPRASEIQGKHVLHSCDVRQCVRYDGLTAYTVNEETFQLYGHLFAANNAVNVADKISKGRARYLYGESHPASKLSDAEITQVCAMVTVGMTQKEVAAMFGIRQNQVSRIVNGKRRIQH